MGPLDLLKKLNPVTPARTDRSTQLGRASAADPSGFLSLVNDAQDGRLRSGRRVHTDRSAGGELDDESLAWIAAAADAAEAAGAYRLSIVMGATLLTLDIPSRTITRAEPACAGVIISDDQPVAVLAPGFESIATVKARRGEDERPFTAADAHREAARLGAAAGIPVVDAADPDRGPVTDPHRGTPCAINLPIPANASLARTLADRRIGA